MNVIKRWVVLMLLFVVVSVFVYTISQENYNNIAVEEREGPILTLSSTEVSDSNDDESWINLIGR